MVKSCISVIVPCYNQGQYLSEAIDSVLAQTYTNWECLIVNDGSIDNTENIALQFQSKDPRISYHYKTNGGLADARNYGIAKSKGDFILPIDADDKIAPGYLEKAIAFFENQEVKVVYCEAEYFGTKSGRWDLPDFSLEQLAKGNMIFCTALFRKQDWQKVGGYNVNMKYGWEDWDFWISLLKNGGKAVKLNEVLFYYRVKEQSMIVNMGLKRRQAMWMQIYLNQPDFFDRYLSEPVEIILDYDTLKKKNEQLKRYINSLEKDNKYLRGLLKLKPSSIVKLFKNAFQKK